MKNKIVMGILSIILIALVGCKGSTTTQPPTQQTPKWTIIGYLDGNNNLDVSNNGTSYVIEDAQNLELVGSSDEVNIIVAVGSIKKGGIVKYYFIEHHEHELPDSLSSPVLENLGTRDMSDPTTLQQFIEYAVQHYPAEHYALLIDDHGGGWRGCCVDDQNGSGNLMTLNQLKSAIQNANVHFDLVIFHACLMAQAEVGYQLKDVADYMVASEFTLPMQSVLNAPEWLDSLVNRPTMTARELSMKIAEAVYNAGQRLQKIVHMAAIDLSYMTALGADIGVLGNRIVDNINGHWDEVQDAWGRTHYTQYDDPAFVDIREFINNLKNEPNVGQNPSIRTAADNVINDLNEAVLRTYTNAPGLTRGGLTIYFPSTQAEFQHDSAAYASIDFVHTNWINFLHQFIVNAGGGGGGTGTVTITGNLTTAGQETQFLPIAVFSHDQVLDQNDAQVQANNPVGLGNFNLSFQIPEGYGQNDYILFVFLGTHCYDLDGDGQADDIFVGFYPPPDAQGNLVLTPLQGSFTGVNVDASYYIQNGCGGGGKFNSTEKFYKIGK